MSNNKTKHRKNHKTKVNNYKNKIKQMTENSNVPQMPPVRNIPVWDKNATIKIKGFEWEVIFNTIQSLQVLQQAASSVMSRNIIEGVIEMDFEKLDPTTLKYVEMTQEEKDPYVKEFHDYITNAKEQMAKVKQQALVVEDSATDIELGAVTTAKEDIIVSNDKPAKKTGKLIKL